LRRAHHLSSLIYGGHAEPVIGRYSRDPVALPTLI